MSSRNNYKKGSYGKSIGNSKRYTSTQNYLKNKAVAKIANNRSKYPAVGGMKQNTSEIKCVDIPEAIYAITNPTSNANVYLLNGVQEGTGEFNRIGRKIFMKSLYMKLRLLATGTVVAGTDAGRVVIVYDRQPNSAGALPPLTTIFQDTDQTGAVSTNAFSGINIDYKDRFQVMFDSKFGLPSASLASANGAGLVELNACETIIQKFIPLKLDVQYSSTANPCTITNINTGALYLCTMGFLAPGSQAWELEGNFRLRYYDK